VKYGTCTVNGMAGVPGLCQQRPSFFVWGSLVNDQGMRPDQVS
jgi:capsule polysaccharide modification protein KpsS